MEARQQVYGEISPASGHPGVRYSIETGARGGIRVAYDFHNWFTPVQTQVVAKLILYKMREDVNLCEMVLQFLIVVSLINLIRQLVYTYS